MGEKQKYIESFGYICINNLYNKYMIISCASNHTRQIPFDKFKLLKDKTCLQCENIIREKELNKYGLTSNNGKYDSYMELKCKNGHIFKRNWRIFSIQNSTTCPQCEIDRKNRLLKESGFTNINGEYGMNMEIMCDKGHITKMTWGHFEERGCKCSQCEQNKVKSMLNNLGMDTTDGVYTNVMNIVCKNGHHFRRSVGDFNNGTHKCTQCVIDEKRKILKQYNYKNLNNEWGKEKMELMCNKGHIFSRTWHNFYNLGSIRCLECEREKLKECLDKNGFKISSGTKDFNTNLELVCDKGHIFTVMLSNFKRSPTCPICNPNRSNFEIQFRDVLNSLNVSFKENVFNVISNRELDFYLPEYNLAIECNGDYWHSSKFRDRDYHLEKLTLCDKQNINLIQIPEWSWYQNTKIWESIIKGKLGLNEKIYARKCEIKIVPKNDEKEFLESNHLQGYCSSKICYGLYYNNELMCLMSFGTPRFSGEYEWELIRLCSKCGYTVVGGASKLFKHFRKENKGTIISYCDKMYSNGDIYKKLGMELIRETKPGYCYIKNGIAYSRQQFMKHKLKDKLEVFDELLTEEQNMANNDYHRMYDCGQMVFALEH